MPKQKFFARLIPPRATFPGDATPEELDLMRVHFEYTLQHFQAGRVLAFGPVFADAGTFGIAIVDADDIAEVHDLMTNDPSVLAGLNTYEISPMRLAGSQAPREAV